MGRESRKKGNIGEDFAAKLLEEKGYRILCRNFKGAHGEIDIIGEKDSYIVFTEVKTRKILSQKPVFSVDDKKLKHIIDTAEEFMSEYKDNNYISSLLLRFDVVEVYTDGEKILSSKHIENILA